MAAGTERVLSKRKVTDEENEAVMVHILGATSSKHKRTMSTINNEYRDIYYQIYDGQNLANVWSINRKVNDPSFTNVAHLLRRIHSEEQLQCRARELRLYGSGTTVEDYDDNRGMQSLGISLPLSDSRVLSATEEKPLLVVVKPISSATPLPASTVSNITTIQEGQIDDVAEKIAEKMLSSNSKTHFLLEEVLASNKKPREESTIGFSNVSSKQYESILDKLTIQLSAPEWKDRPDFDDLYEETFQWSAEKEDSEVNRKEYMAYLNNLGFPQSVKLFEGSAAKDLLNTELSSAGLRVKGNIDVVVVNRNHQDISTAKHNILMGIELKKVENTHDTTIKKQVVLQHLAASKLNSKTGVLTLMTDLEGRWHFYWFQDRPKKLIQYKAKRSEAVHLIKHFLDEPTKGLSVPESFLSRASWDSIFNALGSIQEEVQSDQNGRSPEDASDSTGSSNMDDVDCDSDNASSGGLEAANTRDQRRKKQRNSAPNKQMQSGFASSNLDFMDEDERRDEIFRMVLQNPHNRYLFPEPEPEVGDTSGDAPPREIILG